MSKDLENEDRLTDDGETCLRLRSFLVELEIVIMDSLASLVL
jgi:hypothetical protein